MVAKDEGGVGGSRRDPCGAGIILSFNLISVNVLVMMLYSSFMKHYHWGKVGKMYTGILC